MRQPRLSAKQRPLFGVVLLAALALVLSLARCLPSLYAQDAWEASIRAFEEQDKANPSKPGCIVFAGSSSFRDWDTLVSDMKPLDVLNRGFGGSEMPDLNYYAKRIVIVYKPSAVVIYEGDNDLADSAKSPQMVAGDFRRFIQIMHTSLPDTWIYILSIKPSKARWEQWPKMQMANTLIQNYALTQQHTQFIDIATPMFDAKGNLPNDLFKSDGLHPTAKLYAMWTAIIKPILMQRFGPAAKNAAQLGARAACVPGGESACSFSPELKRPSDHSASEKLTEAGGKSLSSLLE
jgi:lysophospholipase L1-like esterase